jgi:hypothetical protein
MPFPIIPVLATVTLAGIGGAAAWWFTRDEEEDAPAALAPKPGVGTTALPARPEGGSGIPTLPATRQPYGTGLLPAVPVPVPSPNDDDEGDLILEDFEDIDVGPSSGSSSSSSGSRPPNVSRDPAGYNTEMYPDPKSVRRGLDFLGYDMPIVNVPPPDDAVGAFQEDWNEAVASGFAGATGKLSVDRVPGKYTLRALEIATSGTDGASILDLYRGPAWSNRFGL